jgi:hypothetical protein
MSACDESTYLGFDFSTQQVIIKLCVLNRDLQSIFVIVH